MDTSTGNFREKLDELFPGAILEGQFVERAVRGLKSAGFSGENSIACVGVCRDELCDPFVHEVIARFGPTFGMRGLGGFLSCGNTGFGAAHAHSPVVDGRRRFVYFVAPHIAIDELGAVRTRLEAKRVASSRLHAGTKNGARRWYSRRPKTTP